MSGAMSAMGILRRNALFAKTKTKYRSGFLHDSKWWQVLYQCWHTSTLWRIVYDATPVEGGEEVEALTSVAAERWSLFDLNLSSYSLFLPLLHCIIVYQELSNTCFLLTAMPLMKYQTSAQLVAGVLKPIVKPIKQNYCSKYEELEDGVKCPL